MSGRKDPRHSVVLPPGDPRHGLNGYSNYRCRCEACRTANAVAVAGQRARRRVLLARFPDTSVVQHGDAGTYSNWGCRCQPCRAAHAVARYQQKARAASQPP